ncbi:MAG: tRNA (adenosine(37)-N6)-threonylcarbamoyltransferase complex dimerization subunit type 1 TsaB [Chitinophagaceae bacterium]|nr:tRNA (adenosine(37)-N6)-threonylcarbamoyltransferase complex dimerization subunit type 1 TsaB [Oligoflexus sp.]
MILLVIDTSLQGVTLGLAKLDDDEKYYEVLELYGSSHPQEAAARLPELCNTLLEKRGWTTKDLGGMLVSNGPGSFTGIKIGLSFASGWKRAGTPIKIWAVSSFKALLKQFDDVEVLLLAATQTAGYLALTVDSQTKVGVIDLNLSSIASLYNEIDDTQSPILPARLNQAGIVGSWPRLEQWLSAESIVWKAIDSTRLHQAVVAGMIEEFVAKSASRCEGNLMPIYLRKSAPEEKLEAAQRKAPGSNGA